MGRTVDPPQDPEALKNLIGNGNAPPAGQTPPPSGSAPKDDKQAGRHAGQVKPLPAGTFGDPCKVTKGCKGKLTELSRAHIAKKEGAKGRTLITFMCNTCNKAQAQADIPDVE